MEGETDGETDAEGLIEAASPAWLIIWLSVSLGIEHPKPLFIGSIIKIFANIPETTVP